MKFFRRLIDWETMRKQILRETETFLEEGLRDPKKAPRIPAVRVGRGYFPRRFAEAFWRRILGE